MKKLDLNQMENLEGGLRNNGSWACTIALAKFTLATGGVVAGGPLTWWAGAGLLVLWANAVESCAN